MLQILTSIHMPLALVTDPTWVFFVVLMIILFSPILLRRLRTPHIIGLILAGVYDRPAWFQHHREGQEF